MRRALSILLLAFRASLHAAGPPPTIAPLPSSQAVDAAPSPSSAPLPASSDSSVLDTPPLVSDAPPFPKGSSPALPLTGGSPLDRPPEEAASAFQKIGTPTVEQVSATRASAESGDRTAQIRLALMYSLGRGLARDDAQAATWLRKAADQGSAFAQCNLALMYLFGRGVEKDLGQGLDLMRKAADQGNPQAQYNLGLIYTRGLGVAADPDQAAALYRLSAEQNYPPAECALATCYLKGRGLEQDSAQALGWYGRAAGQGDVQAQHDLGVIYLSGIGVPKDPAQARKWFRLAASQGDDFAFEKLIALIEAKQGFSLKLTIESFKTSAAEEAAKRRITDPAQVDLFVRRFVVEHLPAN